MNKWFYAKDGQAIGPLSTPEMHDLIGQGACTRTTLVWTRGMRDWLPACMAAWMWEARPERGERTDDARPDDARTGEAGDSVAASDRIPPAVPGDPHAHRQDQSAGTGQSPDEVAQASNGDGADAGVVGMVRKLFGLG